MRAVPYCNSVPWLNQVNNNWKTCWQQEEPFVKLPETNSLYWVQGQGGGGTDGGREIKISWGKAAGIVHCMHNRWTNEVVYTVKQGILATNHIWQNWQQRTTIVPKLRVYSFNNRTTCFMCGLQNVHKCVGKRGVLCCSKWKTRLPWTANGRKRGTH